MPAPGVALAVTGCRPGSAAVAWATALPNFTPPKPSGSVAGVAAAAVASHTATARVARRSGVERGLDAAPGTVGSNRAALLAGEGAGRGQVVVEQGVQRRQRADGLAAAGVAGEH